MNTQDLIAQLAAKATVHAVPEPEPEPARMDAQAHTAALTGAELAALTTKHGSDLNRAEFVAERVQGRLIHVEGPGWYVWTGTHWGLDVSPGGAKAREMVQDISHELRALAQNSRDDYAEAAAKAMRQSGNITAIMLEMRSMRAIRRDVEELDADPWALNAANGTIDLRTGRIREHNPADLITYALGYDYHADADMTRWWDFVSSCHPDDPEMQEFLQRLTGYGATASTREEVFAYFYGEGSNGKTTFMEAVGHVLAPVTTAMNNTFWQTTKQERNGALIAKLHGARLVLSSEMANTRIDETHVKAVVSGDSLSANPKYKAPFTFRPVGLVVMAGNARPVIQGTDAGIWRRTRFVPWLESFEGRKDVSLKDDLQRREHAEGVLRYIVEGAARWYAEGLNAPASVMEATDELREDLNPFTDWIDATFATGPDAFVSNADIQKKGKTSGAGLPGHPTSWPARVAEHFGLKVDRKRVDGKVTKGITGVRIAEATRIFETDPDAVMGYRG